MFDAYLCVGGDVFPDNADYTKRKKYIKSVKQVHGAVVFWGFSLFRDYSLCTKQDIIEMMQDADIIAPRDEMSSELLRHWLPEKSIETIADTAFLSRWLQKDTGSATGILGISVRHPNYATDQDMQRYVEKLQEVINTYLNGNRERRVTLFSLSNGKTCDTDVAEQIIFGVTESSRVKHTIYIGNTDSIKTEIADCDLMICTRLHAMISCIAMGVPFIPIIYEVKMENILMEIHYPQKWIYFSNLDGLLPQVMEFLRTSASGGVWDVGFSKDYINRTLSMKNKIQALRNQDNRVSKIIKENITGPTCTEKEYIAATFKAALHQRAIDVTTLEEALKQRGIDVATLEEALKQRGTDVATLEEALKQRGTDVATLEARLQSIETTKPYRFAAKILKCYGAVKAVFIRN